MISPLPQQRDRVQATAARTLILLAALALTVWSQWPGAHAGAHFGDEWLRDTAIRLQASAAPETRVVVVDVDEASLRIAGAWPWPRERMAQLLENLIDPYGARGIALDILLPEPGAPAGDARLAMLARLAPLVLPQSMVFEGDGALRVGRLSGGYAAAAPGAASVAKGYVANHAGLAQSAHFGNIGFIPDPDGMLRRLPLQSWFDGRRYPALSLALLDCCSGAAGAAARGPTGGMAQADGWRRLPYSRQWEAYTVISAADILERNVPAAMVAGKLVVVGSSALGLADRVVTPLAASTNGLLVHAAALTAQLDARQGLAPAPWPGRAIAVLYAAALSLLCLLTLPRLSAWSNVALLAGAALLWLGLAYLTIPHDAEFSSSGPLMSCLFLLAIATPYAWQQSQRQSRRLLGTLRQYVADAVVDELLRSNLADPLAPTRCEVTTLIADMQGYTHHVAALPVEAAAQLTRDFLDCLTAPVLARRGTLDKYTGDGLVAFWGAPLPVADHADQALDAALAIMQAMTLFNRRRAQRGAAPVRVRIGIESGTAMAGDFGSRSRSIYTAVGDSVNVASRLETAARDHPYDVIVGPGTAALCRPGRLMQIGQATLRGKDHLTTLYTLTAPGPEKGFP